MFRSVIHLGLTFVKSIKVCLVVFCLFVCMWMSSWFSTICWRDSLCIGLSLLFHQRSVDNINGNLVLPAFYSSTNTTLYWSWLLYTKPLKSSSASPLILFFSFNIILTILDLLFFYINFKNQFVKIHKITCWYSN